MGTENKTPEFTQPSIEVNVEHGPGIKDLVLLILEPSKSGQQHNPRTFTFVFWCDEAGARRKQEIKCLINAIPWGMSYEGHKARGLHLTAAQAMPLEKFKAELITFEGEYDFNTRKGAGRLTFQKIDTD